MDCLFYSLSLKRFPFDTHNPIGYLIAFVVEYIVLAYEFFIVACTLALGIGTFWFGISITKTIQCILHAIGNQSQANKQSNQLKVLFSEYVHAHAEIKQLSVISIKYKEQKHFWNSRMWIKVSHVSHFEIIFWTHFYSLNLQDQNFTSVFIFVHWKLIFLELPMIFLTSFNP